MAQPRQSGVRNQHPKKSYRSGRSSFNGFHGTRDPLFESWMVRKQCTEKRARLYSFQVTSPSVCQVCVAFPPAFWAKCVCVCVYLTWLWGLNDQALDQCLLLLTRTSPRGVVGAAGQGNTQRSHVESVETRNWCLRGTQESLGLVSAPLPERSPATSLASRRELIIPYAISYGFPPRRIPWPLAALGQFLVSVPFRNVICSR